MRHDMPDVGLANTAIAVPQMVSQPPNVLPGKPGHEIFGLFSKLGHGGHGHHGAGAGPGYGHGHGGYGDPYGLMMQGTLVFPHHTFVRSPRDFFMYEPGR